MTSAALLLCPLLAIGAPRIAVSIAPLHGLVSEITDGVSEPALIYERQQSPHGTAISPGQLKQLMDADVVIWVGPTLEAGLARLMLRLPQRTEVLNWDDYDAAMARYRVRDNLFAAASPEDEHDEAPEDEAAEAHAHDQGEWDPHFWLSVANARAFVESVTQHLVRIHPEAAERYRANAERLDRALAELEGHLAERLAPVREQPFIVFHDGFQYFEKAFDLNALGAVVINPSVPPGPKTLDRLAHLETARDGVCLFHEPQFSDRWMQPLTRLLDRAQIAKVDPLGALQTPGAGHYQALMTHLADDVAGCLETIL